ncbi:TPA: hypothetical protein ACWXL4_001228 [Escherichia coli]|nr:hypothetical protein [Escherichia coli]MED9741949.1 hypothetical protein [Escherichia coli]
MAKVIFEFNSPESMEYQGKDASCISMTVRAIELSRRRKPDRMTCSRALLRAWDRKSLKRHPESY